MLGLFKRATPCDTAGLGVERIAACLADGAALPAGTLGLVFDQAGRLRRMAPQARVALAKGESACCFHPGPYRIDVVPFAAAPEIGLRVTFAVDAADPRVVQQRFDLFLASEALGELTLACMHAAIEEALRRELAQGNLDLPPCTSLEEWNAFRGGFNRLVYMRFGLTVDDCVPVDLGESVDYAAILGERAVAAEALPLPLPPTTPLSQRFDGPAADAQALRRLFLELPSVMCALRLAVLPPGQALFQRHRALLLRLDLASVTVCTMPALDLAAPNQPLDELRQDRRAHASLRAAATLDEAWALLARLPHAPDEAMPALLDDFDRIGANLEEALIARHSLDGEAP